MRICIDYCKPKAGTVKNWYPLSLIRETIMQLQRAKILITLDIRHAYNIICIADGDERRTAFRNQWGLFETLVMPFGLTIVPADLEQFVNDVLRPYLNPICTAYLNNVLIYAETLKNMRTTYAGFSMLCTMLAFTSNLRNAALTKYLRRTLASSLQR